MRVIFAGDSLSENSENLSFKGLEKNGMDGSIATGVSEALGCKSVGSYSWKNPFPFDVEKVVRSWFPGASFWGEFPSVFNNEGMNSDPDAECQTLTLTGGRIVDWVNSDWFGTSIYPGNGKFLPNGQTVAEKLASMADEKTELFIMWAGQNDLLSGTIIIGEFDLERYISAFEKVLAGVKARAPRATQVVVLPLDVTLLFEHHPGPFNRESPNGEVEHISSFWTIKPFARELFGVKEAVLTDAEMEKFKKRYASATEAVREKAEALGATLIDVNYAAAATVKRFGAGKITSGDGFHPIKPFRDVLELSILHELKLKGIEPLPGDTYVAKKALAMNVKSATVRSYIVNGGIDAIVGEMDPKIPGNSDAELAFNRWSYDVGGVSRFKPPYNVEFGGGVYYGMAEIRPSADIFLNLTTIPFMFNSWLYYRPVVSVSGSYMPESKREPGAMHGFWGSADLSLALNVDPKSLTTVVVDIFEYMFPNNSMRMGGISMNFNCGTPHVRTELVVGLKPVFDVKGRDFPISIFAGLKLTGSVF